jgi:predicted DNA-binding transcriptional regulator YafY
MRICVFIFGISARTFDRDKRRYLILSGIPIQYNRKDKVYYIDEDVEDPSVSRMIEASFQYIKR